MRARSKIKDEMKYCEKLLCMVLNSVSFFVVQINAGLFQKCLSFLNNLAVLMLIEEWQ